MKIIAFIRAYNAEKTISRAIESIYNQRYDDFTLYVCDDASDDETPQIISAFAKNDSRIVPILIEERVDNRFVKYHCCILSHVVSKYKDEDYFCLMDGDDEFHPDFFLKMIDFMGTNDLEWGACGFDIIDSLDHSIVETKSESIVCDGKYLAENFLKYRRFTDDTWGHFYKVAILKKLKKLIVPYESNDLVNYFTNQPMTLEETITCKQSFANYYNFEIIKNSKRIGILPDALYKYYIYHNSVQRSYREGLFERRKLFYEVMRDFLLSYGDINEEKQNYLFAVYWRSVTDIVTLLLSSEIALGQKLTCLLEIFACQLTKDCLKWEADPIYKNLSERNTYIQSVLEWIRIQSDNWQYAFVISEIEGNIRKGGNA